MSKGISTEKKGLTPAGEYKIIRKNYMVAENLSRISSLEREALIAP